jgi:hypothetical protein
MLVFFYQQIYARAVKIFWLLPFPDEPLFMANSMIGMHPQDAGATPEKVERGRVLRSAIARYILASCFIACSSVCPKFDKAYPGKPTDQMVKLGLLTGSEAETIEHRHDKLPYLAELHFIPIVWAQYVQLQSAL